MRILIAGCGDVGSILAVSLLREGHTVYGLKRDISTLPEGVLPVQADLTDLNSLNDLPGEIDTLVFMPTPARRDQAAYEAIFIEGWKNIWVSLKQPPLRTLLVSSTAVYGESQNELITEAVVPEPEAFNGKVLLQMERHAARCTDNLVVVRFSGIYGPGREYLIRLAASPGLEVQKSPPDFTNRIHSHDAAAVLKYLVEAEHPQSLYLATDNEPAPRFEVVEWLAEAQGKPAPIGLVGQHLGVGKRISNKRLRDEGFLLMYPDFRAGYGAILKKRTKNEVSS